LIVLDTSALFAGLVPDQPGHEAVRRALDEESPPHVLSPFVLAEIDYFLGHRGSVDAEVEFLGEVVLGAYHLASFDGSDLDRASSVLERYADLNIGLTDASIVVLAGRYGTNRVLIFDERHFRALRTPEGDPFVILPADARATAPSP
jgi:uncharacterized protein